MAFGVGTLLSYRSVLAPDSLPLTDSRRVTFDEVTLSHPQGQGVTDAISTPLHVPPTSAPPVSIPTQLVSVGPVPHASASRFNLESDGAIPRQRLSSAYSPLPPSLSCRQASPSPEPLACPLVLPNELTQVTDLLALFTGVVSTTPVVISIWPTPLTTPSSEQSVVVAPRVGTVPAPTQRLNHAFEGPADPSRHMPVASSVTTPLAKSSGHGLDNKDANDLDEFLHNPDEVCCWKRGIFPLQPPG